MKMRVILFDVDGTLIHGEGSGRKALELAFAATFGVVQVREATRKVRFSGVLDPVIHSGMAAALAIDPELLAERREALVSSYLEYLAPACRQDGSSRVLPGVLDLLSGLQGNQATHLGLITGNIEAGARLKLEVHGLNRFFTTGGFGDDATTRSAVARVALQRATVHLPEPVPPPQVVVIGDSELDVECGKRNGYTTLAVGTGWTQPEVLAATGPDLLVEDLGNTAKILEFIASAGEQPQ
jgi:phosphoglycolate phosphatase